MLDRPGNSTRNIQGWRNHFTGLANLELMVDPTGIHDRARSSLSGSEGFGKSAYEMKILRPLQATTARNNNFGFGKFDGVAHGLVHFGDAAFDFGWVQANFQFRSCRLIF